jgi:hypothetical protein
MELCYVPTDLEFSFVVVEVQMSKALSSSEKK